MTKHIDPKTLRALPVAERLKLIEELWDSLDAERDEIPLLEWQREEIDRRIEALEIGASTGAPWDVVRRRVTGEP